MFMDEVIRCLECALKSPLVKRGTWRIRSNEGGDCCSGVMTGMWGSYDPINLSHTELLTFDHF